MDKANERIREAFIETSKIFISNNCAYLKKCKKQSMYLYKLSSLKDYQIAVSFELPKCILLAKFKAYFHSQGNPMPPCLTFKQQQVKFR